MKENQQGYIRVKVVVLSGQKPRCKSPGRWFKNSTANDQKRAVENCVRVLENVESRLLAI